MFHKAQPTEDFTDMSESTRAKISGFIEREFGIKMPPAKKTLLTSRLAKRLRAVKCADFEEYFNYINSPEGLAHEMFVFADLVSTHETSFFRETQHFEILYNTILPELKSKGAGTGRAINIWSAGSSTGEEAYSIALTCEAFGRQNGVDNIRYTITGTDLSSKVLEVASRAIYNTSRLKSIPAGYMRYIMTSKNPDAHSIRIVPEIRSKTRFMILNLISDSYPLEKNFDIIFCRNTLIYFEREIQEKICRRFLNHLNDGGYLFVGHSESLIGFSLPVKVVIPTVYRKD